ncbi:MULTISPECIES: GNAT family N-acetyltransferase [Acinetobacter]|uniref:GNAT family N-acetyltransferase n=1 Tax=Acinetobacter schindleri TaxID=108981 RepID=A0AAE7BXN4_9GAMM|nr:MULTISPECIES: GNAT family N-acetyltransferase [Acinetobacter]QIC68232.1 GNAT family N-acetyltransferase [Acinetobacter schindleri]UNT59611.1 GNAT family N-acetyltransferase [Acinetobacter sp. ASP199]
MQLVISDSDSVQESEILELYCANQWSAAEKPQLLLEALNHSHSLVTARIDGRLVGLGNAISDGYLVVYFPHLLVHPELQGQGIGRRIVQTLLERYAGFHQKILVADQHATGFYQALGFSPAGQTEAMWIYQGTDH